MYFCKGFLGHPTLLACISKTFWRQPSGFWLLLILSLYFTFEDYLHCLVWHHSFQHSFTCMNLQFVFILSYGSKITQKNWVGKSSFFLLWKSQILYQISILSNKWPISKEHLHRNYSLKKVACAVTITYRSVNITI